MHVVYILYVVLYLVYGILINVGIAGTGVGAEWEGLCPTYLFNIDAKCCWVNTRSEVVPYGSSRCGKKKHFHQWVREVLKNRPRVHCCCTADVLCVRYLTAHVFKVASGTGAVLRCSHVNVHVKKQKGLYVPVVYWCVLEECTQLVCICNAAEVHCCKGNGQ